MPQLSTNNTKFSDQFSDLRFELIDPSLDLSPDTGSSGLYESWHDLKTNVIFELRPQQVNKVDMENRRFLILLDDDRKTILADANLDRISKTIEPVKRFVYRVSRAEILSHINLAINNNLVSAALRELRDDDKFVDYFLKGVRACHRRFLRVGEDGDGNCVFVTRDLANVVDFEIVD